MGIGGWVGWRGLPPGIISPSFLLFQKEQRFEGFIRNIQTYCENSSWCDILRYKYEDYQYTEEEVLNLRSYCRQVIQNFSESMLQYENDPLSGPTMLHVTGTSEQADSDLWKSARKMKITASKIKQFNRSQVSNLGLKALIWDEERDISKIAAVAWGKKYESEAFQDAEAALQMKFQKCGIFFLRYFPFIGATPDGYIPGKCVLELKCPFSIKGMHPKDAGGKCLFLKKKDETVSLIKTHPYYYQVQTQMFVCRVKVGYFCT